MTLTLNVEEVPPVDYLITSSDTVEKLRLFHRISQYLCEYAKQDASGMQCSGREIDRTWVL